MRKINLRITELRKAKNVTQQEMADTNEFWNATVSEEEKEKVVETNGDYVY